LNAAKNNIISSVNQEITIDQNGLQGKEVDTGSDSIDGYSPNQVWLVNNMLAFTQDGWNTASLALGELNVNGTNMYGLCASVLIGQIIAGNQLTIENDDNTFTVDGQGATLTNATLSVLGNSGKNNILLDPQHGFKIQSLVNNAFVDKFYVDLAGNVTFGGVLNGASGTFSGTINATIGSNIAGWTTSATALTSPSGDFIGSNGNFKIGKLTVTGSTAKFDGTIYARNLDPSNPVQGTQITNIVADTITSGTINGIHINGSTITWPGVSMNATSLGASVIQFSNSIGIGKSNGTFIQTPSIAVNYQSGNNDNIVLDTYNLYLGHNLGTSIQFRTANLFTSDGSQAQNRVITLYDTDNNSHTLVFTSGLLTSMN
jgi:hypothetical protein